MEHPWPPQAGRNTQNDKNFQKLAKISITSRVCVYYICNTKTYKNYILQKTLNNFDKHKFKQKKPKQKKLINKKNRKITNTRKTCKTWGSKTENDLLALN